ncbi:ras guanine nucleotide exchange factor domain-containing protein [Gongronella butleri]|nr:ras guanine nucleotide exchange factor domain-containing protein [Gongronella butleri]
MSKEASAPMLVCRVQALYPYTAQDGSSLSFERGDIIDVLSQLPSGWWDGYCKGTRGWFPSNYTKVIQEDPSSQDTTASTDLPAAEHRDDMDIPRPLPPQLQLSPTEAPSRQLFDDNLDNASISSSNLTTDVKRDHPPPLDDDSRPATDPLMVDDSLASDSDQKSYMDSRNGSVDDPSRVYTADANATGGNNYDNDWLENDQRQLPAPWIRRSLPQGGTCFYNMNTHEIAWDINDIRRERARESSIDSATSSRKGSLDVPRPHPRSPARRMSARRGSVISNNEPLTWKKLSIHIALAIHNLNIVSRNGNNTGDSHHTPPQVHYDDYTSSIVDAIRLMLLASGTVDKDDVSLRAHPTLKAHHRTMMAALSKLILSTQSCSNAFSKNAMAKMLADGNELLMATRNFISTCEAIPIPVHHIDPQLLDHAKQTNSLRYTMDGELAENIEAYGNNIQESIDSMIAGIDRYQQLQQKDDDNATKSAKGKEIASNAVPPVSDPAMPNSSDLVAFSSSLFSQFRSFGNQIGQFDAIFDEINYTGFPTQELQELRDARSLLLTLLGSLFCNMQALTSEAADASGILGTLRGIGNDMKNTIDTVCACIDRLAFDPALKHVTLQQQQHQQQQGTAMRTSILTSPPSAAKPRITSSIGSASLHGSQRIDRDSSITTTNTTIDEDDENGDDNESYYTDVQTNYSSSHHGGPGTATTGDLPEDLELTGQLVAQQPPRQSTAKLKQFFGDDIPEHMAMPPPLPSGINGAPGSGGAVGNAGNAPGNAPGGANASGSNANTAELHDSNLQDKDRPWYLQYDYKPSEIVFNMEGSVKGATLEALVVRLTLHDYLDMNFINTFLLTYRSFCTSMQLLKCLEQRYMIQQPTGLTPDQIEVWTNKKLKLIRLRVFNVLKTWLEMAYNNEDDTDVLDELERFTTTTIRSTLRFSAEQLERLIAKRRESANDTLKKMVLTLPTSPPLPILPRNRKKFRLLDLDPLEVARQMTIMDFKLYSAIRPVECLNKAWSRDDDEQSSTIATNIRASIEYCNQVTSWVSDAILSQHEVKKRVTLIKFWVQVAERCRQLNNFNTCMAILSAFDNSAVGRLKRTWELVGTRTSQVLSNIRRLMGANRNFTEYRAIIHSINPPCIPFLGIYLQDLTFIEDGNSDYLKTSKHLINFAKRAKTAEVIREIQQYQSTYYQLTSVDELQNFIQTNLQSTRDEEALYSESLRLEPREREDEKITRLLQESGFL